MYTLPLIGAAATVAGFGTLGAVTGVATAAGLSSAEVGTAAILGASFGAGVGTAVAV